MWCEHALRHKTSRGTSAHGLIDSNYGTRKRGRGPKAYIENLISDCECDTVDELLTMMMDREGWKTISRSSRELD